MAGIGATNDLPRRSPGFMGALGAILGRAGVGLPTSVPGGQYGVVPVTSVLSMQRVPAAQPNWKPAGQIPGGNHGKVTLFTPPSAGTANTVPYYLGANYGFSVRSVDGTPIEWIRRYFDNTAGRDGFLPAPPAPTGNWTANVVNMQPAGPLSGIPFSAKRINWGGYRRQYAVDEQLFDQLTSRANPWRIQKPMPHRIHTTTRQPIQRSPFFYRLTQYRQASSYGATTRTILSPALSNVLLGQLPTSGNATPNGGMFGAY